jgi:acyl carrier protein
MRVLAQRGVGMTRADLLKKIAETLSVIVDDPGLTLTEATTAEDVPEWDSINHVKLMIALEQDLNIRFEPDELTAAENVGALIDQIERRLEA